MSRQHINAYRTKLAKLHAVSGSLNEGVISQAFGGLLEAWGRSHDLTLVQQWEGKGPRGNDIKVDGALVPSVLRVPFGYWEAKDSKDDLDREIAGKIAAGYPDDNIIYENSVTAVLRQDGKEADRAPLQGDDEALLALINRFFDYERAEIAEFRKAAAQFQTDLPQILQALRGAIGEAEKANYAYAAAAKAFLDHAREAINPLVTAADVREMLIQHILTEEIFTSVFDNAQYHRENNVAEKLTELESQFFTGDLRHQTTLRLRPYYAAIKSAAAETPDRREKQTFLKNLYEDFYKVYNWKAADRLGVVYTPGEIVRFMIRGAEWLTERHFGKTLIDPQVEILDPATGTGTFIVELLEHFAGDRDRLRYKYKNELHANEVAILPYYVANLNIEATYAAITGQYAEFPGLVFVDTLDNTAGLGIYKGHQGDMFGSMSDENMDRIKRQNERRISLVIGNPPYNANQKNENENNKNREYPEIDRRIRKTYQVRGMSHKAKSYDMYSRFIRWSSDRIGDDGIVAFVANRSFVDKRAFDGFRKVAAEEFSEIRVVDLFGDVRDSVRRGGNVFPNTIGTAIVFLVRKAAGGEADVYISEIDKGSGPDKLSLLEQSELTDLTWRTVAHVEQGYWSSEALAVDREGILIVPAKLSGTASERTDPSIFGEASFGFVSNRDDWVLDRDTVRLEDKIKFYLAVYVTTVRSLPPKIDGPIDPHLNYAIKWTDDLRKYAAARKEIAFNPELIRKVLYRPYAIRVHYHTGDTNWSLYKLPAFFPQPETVNPTIYFSDRGARAPFTTLATGLPAELHLAASTDGFQGISRYRYSRSGERMDNITDWALAQFRSHYASERPGPGRGSGEGRTGPRPEPGNKAEISRDDIFAYVYAVLHDPVYRETYTADLRRELPRIPFYPDFARWADYGRTLLDLHIGYEKAKPWKLTRTDTPGKNDAVPKLKSEPDKGVVIVDSETQLGGIPAEAWDYRLGNRSAIDWVLDQHKEKKIKDPTVAAKFNTYKFANHKESMIKLLGRVVRVSVETVKITEAIRALDRTGWDAS